MRKRPDFLYIGPSRSGSTWLYTALRNHPQIFLPATKELHYFDYYYHLGPDWYYKHFEEARPEHKVIGEFSPDYLYFPEALDRISTELGSVTMLSCLRHPVDRVYSEYLYVVKLGFARGTFEEVLTKCPQLIEHSMYGRQLIAFRDRMPSSKLLIIDFNRIKAEPDDLFLDLCEGLGVDREIPGDFKRGKIHGSAAPRNFVVAKTAKKISDALLRRGGDRVVTKLKALPFVTTLLYRTRPDVEKTAEDIETCERIRGLFAEDAALLDREFGSQYSRIWGYDSASAPWPACDAQLRG